MKKPKKDEKLQSRREFFKKAAKSALPILSAIVLASTPTLLKAKDTPPQFCMFGCAGYCAGQCYATCMGGCYGNCIGCVGYCKQGCIGCAVACNSNCSGSCATECALSCAACE